MIGVTLSRWTMSYFAAALGSLAVALALMAAGYGYPNAPLRAPETLVLVHIVTLGWLSLLMCGALFQFVPVLVARPLYSDTLPLPTLLCLLGGLAALLLGFLRLAGTIDSSLPLFALAAVLLGSGFTLALWTLGRTLWPARPLPLPARFVTVGLFSIAATVLLGIVFALALGGETSYGPLLELHAGGLPLHVIAGLGGWLTFTAMGVSYRLLAMFMLAPELNRRASRTALHLGTCALVLAVGAGSLAIVLGFAVAPVLLAAGALGLTALVLYGIDIRHLYRSRKRRTVELNSRMALFALASLALAAVLLVGALALGRLPQALGPLVFLVAFGWLTGLGLAKLYKIVAFLTWLECYGPVLGKTPTPRVQDLVVEKRGIRWFVLYFIGAWAATLALLADIAPAFQGAAALMLAATAGIVVQIVRTRRLADVKTAVRLPDGARQPHLLFSLPRHS